MQSSQVKSIEVGEGGLLLNWGVVGGGQHEKWPHFPPVFLTLSLLVGLIHTGLRWNGHLYKNKNKLTAGHAGQQVGPKLTE